MSKANPFDAVTADDEKLAAVRLMPASNKASKSASVSAAPKIRKKKAPPAQWNVRVPADLAQLVAKKCRKEGISKTDLTVDLLEWWVK